MHAYTCMSQRERATFYISTCRHCAGIEPIVCVSQQYKEVTLGRSLRLALIYSFIVFQPSVDLVSHCPSAEKRFLHAALTISTVDRKLSLNKSWALNSFCYP